MKNLMGTGVALITPFKEDKSIDFPALEKLVDYTIEGGVEFLVVLGTTAETATLTAEEQKAVIETVIRANKQRVALVLGIGGNNTTAVVEAYKTSDLGAFEAVLTVSPYYNRPSQEGIYQHYKMIASQTDSKIILYNVPSRTGSNIEAETTVRLANEFDNIIAIKEASPNFLQSTDVLRQNTRRDFFVLSGDDEFALPMTLAGGKGVISVIAQGIPQQFSSMIRLGLERKVDQAYEAHYKMVEITRAIFAEGNPAGIKSVLHHQGICSPYTRLPLMPATENLSQTIKKILNNIN
ncbi:MULTISPECIES: 4-hydroxy-tetrahydrodipicolinate synthase [Weeksella]|nr:MULTISPECIES: 4-hydroxy-tetrahydrodipicolinate synthase [Weeksella]MDK7375148.1 4-hydroxy-tetrahydrodipicolinate synthase [Weeksella virosa]MDK7675827.1 4-hydroxy-tetrahydrodipicolinate synthase [Weeksella virosa]OFM85322.1 4-hydroxy-tetrahydrodipicolinate synthase [Weeksella sp. HMSC059D05]SUP55036.1 Dihydrodipicolinate synthase [Weeksella virosa]